MKTNFSNFESMWQFGHINTVMREANNSSAMVEISFMRSDVEQY